MQGTVQSVLGCDGDWDPSCEATFLEFSPEDGIWFASFDLPAGEYEYKAALNGSWDADFGLGAEAGGANIPLVLSEDSTVTFYFDADSGWITDDVNSLIANVAGNFQSEIGCPGDWSPDCLQTWLQDADGDGIYVYETASMPEGEWEAKVAVGQTWDISYGVDGVEGGDNIAFVVPEGGALVTFSFDSMTNMIDIATGDVPEVVDTEDAPDDGDEDSVTMSVIPTLPQTDIENPETVTIAGTVQSVLGCSGDWAPDCEATFLTYDEANGIWRGSFDLPAGEYEYKAALNGSWDENYGVGAESYGANIPLVLEEDMTVEFFFDASTGWITDNVNSIIANVPGNFQNTVGCSGDWAPDCLQTWLQDPDGDGVYVFISTDIPAGSYEAKVAVNESWGENYGANGAPDGANIPFDVPADAVVTFVWDTSTQEMTIYVEGEGPTISGNIGIQSAYWVSANTIAWDIDPIDDGQYALHFSLDGGISLGVDGVVGGDMIPLMYNADGLNDAVVAKFPHLSEFSAFTISEDNHSLIPDALRGQLAISASDADGITLGATGLQIPGVLDDLYTYDGDLGVTFADGRVPTLSVWAPTAQNVSVLLYADSNPATAGEEVDMTLDSDTGVWSVSGGADWYGQYYLYNVEVYVHSTGQVENNLVTDPYSYSLSMNSQRSQIIDLTDPAFMPDGWMTLIQPQVDAPEDIVLYELHVRDFSSIDQSVTPDYRGTFMAFTENGSNGMTHLSNLANAGLTHLHLLPTFDIATINENPDERTEPDFTELASFGPDSSEQQAIIDAIRDEDGFNWGYDPYHYTVPEGSYSTNPDGPQRVIEFRAMVQALNQIGLHVVVDVVYNHTNSAGQSERSVLDRIVPGYYHRLSATGGVETSTCCQNTATEHNMMRRLMVDSVVTWAQHYRVGGFRFDLMGHHMLDDMVAVREALDALTLEEHGVDGASIYVYGEGWNFGEVADNQRGINATQLNIGGTGLGAFNDRLRDAVRGGNPFGGYQEQGFATGLFVDPNATDQGSEDEQLALLTLFQDQIRVGLAGNLRDYTFESATGEDVTGFEVLYNGSPAGYTLDPQENIVYVSAHDNETFFDALQYKLPEDTTMADRVRVQNMGMSMTMFSQGVPFFHAGIDMLRSKSFDRNTYNSGDWFNALDFTYESNNWGNGLPAEGDNGDNWSIMQPLLANPDLQPTQADILRAVEHFQELLQIRQSSPLFRLQTADQIMEMLAFYNTGVDQVAGLIVMSITDTQNIDDNYGSVVVIFNSSPDAVDFTEADFVDMGFELHPVLLNSDDAIVQTSTFDASTGTFTVPARTTAVFVLAD